MKKSGRINFTRLIESGLVVDTTKPISITAMNLTQLPVPEADETHSAVEAFKSD